MRKVYRPKYNVGGQILAQVGGGLSNSFDATGVTDTEDSQYSQKTSKYLTRANQADKISSTVSSGLISSGNPYAMAAGAALKASDMINTKLLKNKDGMYKSKGAFAASFLMPGQAIKHAASGNTIFNYDKKKKAMENEIAVGKQNELNLDTVKNTKFANIAKNSMPQYQAPAYGRQGMKFKVVKPY